MWLINNQLILVLKVKLKHYLAQSPKHKLPVPSPQRVSSEVTASPKTLYTDAYTSALGQSPNLIMAKHVSLSIKYHLVEINEITDRKLIPDPSFLSE